MRYASHIRITKRAAAPFPATTSTRWGPLATNALSLPRTVETEIPPPEAIPFLQTTQPLWPWARDKTDKQSSGLRAITCNEGREGTCIMCEGDSIWLSPTLAAVFAARNQ